MLSRWEWITNVLARGGGAPSGEPSWFRCWAETSGLFLLLYAGRLAKEKNLLLLPLTLERLRAMGNLDFRFVIAGSGFFEGELRAAFSECAPRAALFLGQCDSDKLAELYAAADAFVHPNAHEPFGIAPLEAMTAGLPLIAPASGGLLTYANRRNAWLAEPTPGAFATAIRTALLDGEAREEKLERARKTTQEFGWSQVTERYFLLYDRLYARFQNEGIGGRQARWQKESGEREADARDYAPA